MARKRTTTVEIEIDATPGTRTKRVQQVLWSGIPTIDGPFYSQAMRCWRVQYYERGLTYHYSRESSLYIERLEDAQKIEPIIRVASWEAWKEAIKKVKEILSQSETGGYCYVTGIGEWREYLHVHHNPLR